MKLASFSLNVIANYTSQIITILVSVLTLPTLINIMGAESYGLVGIFSLMQSWLMLLDLGISPTLTREIALYRGGALIPSHFKYLLNKIKFLFFVGAFLIVLILFASSNYIVSKWIKVESLSIDTMLYSFKIIALILAIRWVSSIYRAILVGFEKFISLSLINTGFSLARFLIIIPILLYWNNSPIVFFLYQLFLGVIEIFTLILVCKNVVPINIVAEKIPNSNMKAIYKFALSIAFTGSIWIIITQTDKLILSKLLPLSEYGYYSLAVQVAGAITLISNPISSVILPRLTKLEAEKNFEELFALYRSTTKSIVAVAGTLMLVLVFFGNKVIFMWTGSQIIVEKATTFITLYSIGNFFLAIAAFPYYLQYAKGVLKFHLLGNLFFLVFLIPALIYFVSKFGGIGAGYVWIAVNSLYLFIWVPIIHNYFNGKLNKKWFTYDFSFVLLPATIVAYLLKLILPVTPNRFYLFFQILLAGTLILFVSIVASGKLNAIKIKK